jgi:tRNA pseudouridine32 synthase/23S rRNA pseudouridine746 synthase
VSVRFPSPFARAPHPLAREAADLLIAQLPRLDEGKMFGVLVVQDRDRVGVLRAFSGMLQGTWNRDGFVPPVFDAAARDAMWPAGERELNELTARIAALDETKPSALAALDRAHAAALDEVRARHRANRAGRQIDRESAIDDDARHAIDQRSRGDAAEKKKLLAAHAIEREPLAREVAILDEERRALTALRAERSRFYLHALFDMYALPNARGVTRSLREVFAPDEPPGGAGDCAAPKLLAHAYRNGMRPLALAEFWWGPPPSTGGRIEGVFYPACRGKCGPILAHMLDGLDAEPAPVFGANAIDPDEPRVVLEDDAFVIVDKPTGLLSVPGKSAALHDCVETRLARRYGEAYVVHRLDLDASGLLIVAKTREVHAELQRQFACREIDKRYIAVLDGEPACDGGVIELALRVDVDDRPRQIYDPVHGKPALTEWRVIAPVDRGKTRVELVPRTGRAHQLRVHAAHPSGIGVPILGDPLYGREGTRLLLHAAALSFVHPHTKRRVDVSRHPPF